MILACFACGTRFPEGAYRDAACPSCGAIAQPASARPCPRCELPMQARELGDLVVDECSKCLGLFLDHVAIKAVLADRARGESLLDSLPRHEHSALPKGKMYIRCPSCGTVMNRKLFATGSGVVVDVCRSDGMFFDAGELPAIIDFVLAGGLERAAQRDSEREREQAARERLRKQDLGDGEPRRDRTTALVDLLFNLFG